MTETIAFLILFYVLGALIAGLHKATGGIDGRASQCSENEIWAWSLFWPLFTVLYAIRNLFRLVVLAYKGIWEICYTSIEIIKDILKG